MSHVHQQEVQALQEAKSEREEALQSSCAALQAQLRARVGELQAAESAQSAASSAADGLLLDLQASRARELGLREELEGAQGEIRGILEHRAQLTRQLEQQEGAVVAPEGVDLPAALRNGRAAQKREACRVSHEAVAEQVAGGEVLPVQVAAPDPVLAGVVSLPVPPGGEDGGGRRASGHRRRAADGVG